MHDRIFAWARHPQARRWLVVLAVLLVLPSVVAGFFADDFGHYLLINEPGLLPQSGQASPFHLFAFIDADPARRQIQYSYSLIPWWTSENLAINFWRPVSELSHALDYAVFPDKPWLMHLQSIFWYFLLVLLVSSFYKNILPQPHLSVVALLFFAVDATHGMTVSWLANRNALIAAVFALLAFGFYSRFRVSGCKKLLLAAALALLASLFAAEIGITIGGFFLAYALFLDKDGPVKGLQHLWPLLIIVVIWLLAYRYLGYGVAGSAAFYIDPITNPVLYLQALFVRFPLAVSAQFNLLPIHLASFLEKPAVVSGVAIFLALLVVAVRKRDAAYRFFLLAMSLAILPVATTVMQDRNLLFVGIAGAAILARLAGWLAEAVPAASKRRLAGLCLAMILFFHVLVSALLMVPMALAPRFLAKNSIAAAQSIKASPEKKFIISFGVPLFDVGYLAAIRKVYGLPLPERLWNITTFTDGISVQRLPGNHLVIACRQGLLRDEDLLLRNFMQDPVATGQVFDLHGLSIRIIEVNSQGVPVRIELIPDRMTAEDGLQLLYWQDGELIPFSLEGDDVRHFDPVNHNRRWRTTVIGNYLTGG